MSAYKFDTAYRPLLAGRHHMVSAGHYLAAQAGSTILEAGGNAIDAGVAAGLVLNVVEPQMCSFTGVAPIMIYLARQDSLITIDGLGVWPRRVTRELLSAGGAECVPEGILQTVVPGAPDAWLTALEKYGTMRFADVAHAAIRFAREGFVVYPMMALTIKRKLADFPPNSAAAAIFLPHGRAPVSGEIFLQKDLGRTLRHLVDIEAAASRGGREAGIDAVRREFYRGDLAKAFASHQRENGGLLEEQDLAEYRVSIGQPSSVEYRGVELYACGPWCQGPMLLQVIRMVEALNPERAGHNAADYVHAMIETYKLVAADRESYYGDPKFVDVPIETLLSPDYARRRAELVRSDRAWPEMPAPGEIPGCTPLAAPSPVRDQVPAGTGTLDTSYVCVVDAEGNAFSATPSDGVMRKAPVVPGTGMCLSPRGIQSRLDSRHPASVAPGKRPRLTPNPAIAIKRGEFVMPFGTPGGDLQVQAMSQVFLNMFAFGMDAQAAVESARFYSYSYPDSFAPHAYYPGLLKLEAPFPESTANLLRQKGHTVERWPVDEWPRTGVCIAIDDRRQGIKLGAADSRRTSYAVGR